MENGAPSVQQEFLRLVNGAAGYFEFRKTMGAPVLDISQASIDTIRALDVSAGGVTQSAAREERLFISEQGDPGAGLFILTELSDMEKSGDAFAGPAGELLAKIVKAMGLTRETVFTAGFFPSELPPSGPVPLAVVHGIRNRVDRVNPRVVLTFGELAARSVLGPGAEVVRARGRFHDYSRTKVMATFHPDLLLKEPSKKRAVWDDVKMVMKQMQLVRSEKEN
ncbi:MAG TPA: uracil-DNA glycosylase family protein [Desulfobacteraceae bacterium]|nr:uracil-DNA glycosylase family protein [Desulfobacteraceae bacterium]